MDRGGADLARHKRGIEVCAAAIHLIRNPDAATADLVRLMPGSGLSDRRRAGRDAAAILTAYETGRGGFRVRARWEVERGKHGTWQIVVTEIPYQVQKGRRIEQIAALIEEKKLPLLGDVRDESAETVRVVLEPRTRGVEPEVLMETLVSRNHPRTALSAQHACTDTKLARRA